MSASRAAELRDLGYKAFRQGDAAGAHQHFSRALVLFRATHGENHAATATALSDLGVTSASFGDQIQARVHHEAALRIRSALLGPYHEDVAASLHNLGIVCRALGALEEAEANHVAALRIWRARLGPAHPAVARCLIALGHVAAQRGAHGDAALHWRNAVSVLRMQHRGSAAQLAVVLNNLGIAQRNLGDLENAATSFASALATDTDMPEARHNLATLLARQGRAMEAKRHRDIALQQQSVFIETNSGAQSIVLILCSSDAGNVPLHNLLPQPAFGRVWLFIEHASQAELQALPPHDAVFNAAGDPDMAAPIEGKLAAFVATSTKRCLNLPARIAATRRDRLEDTLGARDGMVVPRTLRIESAHEVAAAGLELPLLLRPAGSHGGTGTIRIDAARDLAGVDFSAAVFWYVTAFIDCRAADGFVRKYRVMFVGGVAYPYHLAISDNWLVHYFSAFMPDHPWKLQEEQAFLADWRAVLGERNAAIIDAIGRALDLDYCGVDFGVLPDGRLVVFEANTTMLVHAEDAAGKLSYKNEAVAAIVSAFALVLVGQ